ncbi:hypothetical protein ANN_17140 [Periplaneta americana]|uniref:Autophagy-related protein 16 domain-containing protein n=1 Tax=Periplaneta americana TaxID=6978 RepID=A0ABQ8SS38_PERAM|nr:hypothetical protein ANN_17140 [Periplaneta americana]
MDNRLFDSSNALRGENLHLTIQYEKLRQENFELQHRSGQSDGKPNEKIQALEQKLLHQQEELTELHRRKGENAQQLIDLNNKLQEKEKQLLSLEVSLAESMAVNTTLRAEIQMYQNSIKELENLNQMLKDEHQALQLAFASLEEKLRKAQDENRSLVDRLIRYKSKDADKMNEENENFVRKKQAKLQKELEEAAKDTRAISPDRMKDAGAAGAIFATSVPSRVILKFDAHDGDVNAVKWSPVDRILATGGADRRVKLWDLSKGETELKNSNFAINTMRIQKSVIKFFNAQTIAPIEIHQQLCQVYGPNIMSKQMVCRWCRQFSEGRQSVHDEERSG